MYISVIFFNLFSSVLSFQLFHYDFFNVTNPKRLPLPYDDEFYYGYSVLLQQGNPNQIVIGSPKRKGKNNATSILSICEIENSHCTKYSIPSSSSTPQDHEFLGAAIDGGDKVGDKIIVCAPRACSFAHTYYLNGRCIELQEVTRSKTRMENITLPVNGKFNQIKRVGNANFYEYAYAEAGMSVHYIKDVDEFFVGAPGLTNWNGGVILKSLKYHEYDILPHRQQPQSNYNNAYFGYSVSSGKFTGSDKETIFLAGIPRGNQLKGEVLLFEKSISNSQRMSIRKQFFGEQLGSYFGAAVLAIDLNSDGLDDVVIGAPTYSADLWDEGCVYIFKNLGNNKFQHEGKLFGDRKAGSRFGTVLADLGDVTLTGYKSFAVSAPYEDDGVGAVYIYQSVGTTLSALNYQKITPSSFARVGALGFGQGISRGLDLNKDLYKDVAIGAYKSNEVFLFYGHVVAKFEINITANLSVLHPDTPSFELNFCFQYTQNNKMAPPKGNMSYDLVLDYRARDEPKKTFMSSTNKTVCKKEIVFLKDPVKDFNPFTVTVKTNLENTSGYADLKIPYSYGCGDDGICQTKIEIITDLEKRSAKTMNEFLALSKAKLEPHEVEFWRFETRESLTGNIGAHIYTDTAFESETVRYALHTLATYDVVSTPKLGFLSHIVLGQDKEMKIKVSVQNNGETALQCILLVGIPESVGLINVRNCDLKNGLYECPISNRFTSTSKYDKILHLDMSKLNVETKEVNITLMVKNSGLDVGNKTMVNLTIPVVLKNSPYLAGNSEPDDVVYDNEDDLKRNLSLMYHFTVGNSGPSPYFLNISFLLPNVTDWGESEFVELEELNVIGDDPDIEDSMNCFQTVCSDSLMDKNQTVYHIHKNIPLDRMIAIDYSSNFGNCVGITCYGAYIESGSTAKIGLKISISDLHKFLKYHKKKLLNKDIILFSAVAFINTEEGLVTKTVSTLLYLPVSTTLPLWIAIVTLCVGLIVIAAIILILYKCHFFERSYRDRMQSEMKLLDEEPRSENRFDEIFSEPEGHDNPLS